MSLISAIRSHSNGDDSAEGKFNPFRLLSIGETMVRYSDGIKIKESLYLLILTSDRLILIESTNQTAGLIAKEIPVSVIRNAALERDDKNRPALGVSIEISGRLRVMRFIFTGLVDEPESECREWFSALNSYGPDIGEEAEAPVPAKLEQELKQMPSSAESAEIQVQEHASKKKGVRRDEEIDKVVRVAEKPTEKPAEKTSYQPTDHRSERKPSGIPEIKPDILPEPNYEPADVHTSPTIVNQVSKPIKSTPTQHVMRPSSEPEEGTIRVFIEKPDLHALKVVHNAPFTSSQYLIRQNLHCIHCGSKIPSSARFCQVCGKQQV